MIQITTKGFVKGVCNTVHPVTFSVMRGNQGKGESIMRQIITVDEDKCVGCSACVRACPINANKISLKADSKDQFVTTIDTTACISCGECV